MGRDLQNINTDKPKYNEMISFYYFVAALLTGKIATTCRGVELPVLDKKIIPDLQAEETHYP